MRKLGGNENFERIDAIDFFEYKNKDLDAYYEGTRTIKTPGCEREESTMHDFSRIEDRTKKFGIWSFGLLNSLLNGSTNQPEVVKVGTPLRLRYLGKKLVELSIGSRKVHQVEVSDISDEVAKGEITQTVF